MCLLWYCRPCRLQLTIMSGRPQIPAEACKIPLQLLLVLCIGMGFSFSGLPNSDGRIVSFRNAKCAEIGPPELQLILATFIYTIGAARTRLQSLEESCSPQDARTSFGRLAIYTRCPTHSSWRMGENSNIYIVKGSSIFGLSLLTYFYAVILLVLADFFRMFPSAGWFTVKIKDRIISRSSSY